MSYEKLSSEEIPKKFTEWLLKMGCPAEKVPSLEKVTQMCRGQYYMVWRSLMEHVHPKDTIRHKRLNVFCDDIKICQKNKLYNKSDVVIPEQLELWRKQVELKEKVADAETRVELSRKCIKDLTDKTSIKIIQRNLLRRNLDDIQRRIWLLRLVSEDLAKKKCNLDEAKKISKSMCSDSCDNDIHSKLDECLSMVSKELSTSISSDMPVQERFAKTEQLMSRLTKCGDAMWPLLHEQRVAGVAQLSTANNTTTDTLAQRISPYSIIALTASLHASMAMEVLKNRVLIKQVREKIAAALDEINHTLSHESCELLVLQCEIVHMETRMRTMRSISEDMAQHRGAFSTGRCDVQDPGVTMNKIHDLDALIMNKKEELRRLLVSLVTIEKKIFHMKECVQTVFNAFRGDGSPRPVTCGGMKLDLPDGPISALCQFYRERRARVGSKTNMSLDLDVSDVSCGDYTDENEFTFVDELKIYLKKFNLEKNRKLVLDSGEKIWIFKTLQSALSRINTHWLDKNLPPLFCPSVGLPRNMQNVLDQVKERDALRHIAKRLSNDDKRFVNMDVKPIMDEEAKLTDVVKKQSAENILSLQKINKTLELSQYNLQFWANDSAKKHISANRTVDGRTYEEYEKYYLEHIIIKS